MAALTPRLLDQKSPFPGADILTQMFLRRRRSFRQLKQIKSIKALPTRLGHRLELTPPNLELAMSVKCVAAAVVMACLDAGGACAATTTGRITYMTPDRRQLMLNNSDIYTVNAAVDLSSVAIADRVRINWDRKGGEDVITSLVKAPLTEAAAG
jgi:hypothetical protein